MYYEVLGVPRTASETELRSAYRRAVKASHPDRGGDVDVFRKVQDAWAVLGDPISRQAYDVRSKGSTSPPAAAQQSTAPRPAPAAHATPGSPFVPPTNDQGEAVRPPTGEPPAAGDTFWTPKRLIVGQILLSLAAAASGGVTLWVLTNSGRIVGLGSAAYLALVAGCLVARAAGHADRVEGTYRRLLRAAWILAALCLAMVALQPLTSGPLWAPIAWASVLAVFAGSVTMLDHLLRRA